MLGEFVQAGMIERYDVAGEAYGYISTLKHQQSNIKEAKSTVVSQFEISAPRISN